MMKRLHSGSLGQQARGCIYKLALVIDLVGLTTAAHTTDYSETVSGDLSSDHTTPTSIGDLTLGSNIISGETIPTRPDC